MKKVWQIGLLDLLQETYQCIAYLWSKNMLDSKPLDHLDGFLSILILQSAMSDHSKQPTKVPKLNTGKGRFFHFSFYLVLWITLWTSWLGKGTPTQSRLWFWCFTSLTCSLPQIKLNLYWFWFGVLICVHLSSTPEFCYIKSPKLLFSCFYRSSGESLMKIDFGNLKDQEDLFCSWYSEAYGLIISFLLLWNEFFCKFLADSNFDSLSTNQRARSDSQNMKEEENQNSPSPNAKIIQWDSPSQNSCSYKTQTSNFSLEQMSSGNNTLIHMHLKSIFIEVWCQL